MKRNWKDFFKGTNYLCLLSIIILGLALINACSKSVDLQTGTFVDSPVQGLTYQTATTSGTTGANGTFGYYPNETVTFSVGGVALGATAGTAVVTPVNLVAGATGVTDQTVTNIGIFLQTLDEDGDLNNGIKINTQTRAIVAANAVGLNFNQTAAAFAADPKIIALITALNLNNAAGFTSGEIGGRQMRSATDAQAHMMASTGERKAVTTTFGVVNGYAYDSGTWVWKGVPYAKPPVGALRWKAPLDPDPWTGVREATANCNVCSQHVTNSYWMSSGAFTGSEDCLYLDIYRPKTTDTGLPVYFYIHGGSNNFGSARQYDGSYLAKRGNMIVVYVQYRLAGLGFLTHPALRASGTDEDKSGNYGTLDHIKALNWVKNNIAAFGGDPAKVMIGGQSAGAHNTTNLIISPKSAGLFRAAFIQSDAMDPFTVAYADSMTNTTIKGLLIRDGLATDAASAAAYLGTMTNSQIETFLRNKTAEQILKSRRDGMGAVGSGSMPTHDAIRDGIVIRDSNWTDAIAAGTYNKVPIVIGCTQYEWKDFQPLYGTAVKYIYAAGSNPPVPSSAYTWLDLFKVIGVGGNLTLDAVLPTQLDKDLYGTIADLRSRIWRASYMDTLARAFKANDAANPVYSFVFKWKGGGDPARADFAALFGAAHSMDIPFFQGRETDAWNYSFTTANQAGRVALQGAMMDYLISFAKTLNPNPSGSTLPSWVQWSNTEGANKVITFDANLSNYVIVPDTTEVTRIGLNTEINAARSTYAHAIGVFNAWGITPVVQ
jgi:para-nitrobenzyl esterase